MDIVYDNKKQKQVVQGMREYQRTIGTLSDIVMYKPYGCNYMCPTWTIDYFDNNKQKIYSINKAGYNCNIPLP